MRALLQAPTAVQDDTEQTATALGASPEQIAQLKACRSDDADSPDNDDDLNQPDALTCPIWPDNQTPLRLFMALQTQWVAAPAGGVMGLNYASVPLVAKGLRISPRKQARAMPALQIMEAEGLLILNTPQP